MSSNLRKCKVAAPSTNVVQEILFDPSARQMYLTGFHKRKVQRAKHAQEKAEKRAKEEKREQRRRIREERRTEVERAIAENKALVREINSDFGSEEGGKGEGEDEEWDGIADPTPVDYEKEYIDEDKYTAVTVEEVDTSRKWLWRKDDEEQEDARGGGKENDHEQNDHGEKSEDGSKPAETSMEQDESEEQEYEDE
ncbi:hypothetical protein PAAG_08972 [Paracoccidioides lutzii Pb01]|uniref:Uncharacterized protein n=1 Tax=Paracoccidioides lutzii (strain ATCC MYA-826 / Pb01) TaxID=502779 RepID=C1HDX9_PARBA|nr:hypothetical protein PAAG_08972 [Paracoccidioides lutzii Pb01]EEH40123.2 hypothetical protein PAAG_08972 [Paracoccidioides lutzii Pb01]